jgi:disulfide bond formation protein DsbB
MFSTYSSFTSKSQLPTIRVCLLPGSVHSQVSPQTRFYLSCSVCWLIHVCLFIFILLYLLALLFSELYNVHLSRYCLFLSRVKLYHVWIVNTLGSSHTLIPLSHSFSHSLNFFQSDMQCARAPNAAAEMQL